MKPLFLPPLSTLYGAVTRARRTLYQKGTFKTSKLERPVISVGNITTGGTGKTPLVEWVSRVVAAENKKVCILTRGYGRIDPTRRVIVSDGSKVLATPSEAGDEPYLLATNLTNVAAVISDANRFAAGEGAIKHLGTEVFVLDDGFQHLRLARDLNIVTIDATNPWGGGRLLPFGHLREPLDGLKRADCVVLTRTDQATDLDKLCSEVSARTGDRPIFLSRMRSKGVRALPGSKIMGPASKFAAFCAVGNPRSFFKHLKISGYNVAFERAFGDHHNYTQAEVDSLLVEALNVGADALITTAKDAVKLTSMSLTIPCYVLEVEIVVDKEDDLKRIVRESVS